MTTPRFVQEILSRSKYEFDFNKDHENYSAGYTIKIRKKSAYTRIDTFRKEIERLITWANKAAGIETAYIIDIPLQTHYCNQVAVVTICDPIMQMVEQYIPES